MYEHKSKPPRYCCICGIQINQGHYCIGHQAAYQHEYYAKSQARYDRLKQALKKELVLLQAGPAMGLSLNEAKIKAKIGKLQSQLQQMEKLNPALKSEQEKEEK